MLKKWFGKSADNAAPSEETKSAEDADATEACRQFRLYLAAGPDGQYRQVAIEGLRGLEEAGVGCR